MLFFKKKPRDTRSRLLKLCDEWRAFEMVELDRPHLEARLRSLAQRLEQEAGEYAPVLQEAGRKGTADDVEFLFQVVAELPEATGGKTLRALGGDTIPNSRADSGHVPGLEDFTWERAEKELGAIARVASGIRVPIQQDIRQSWQKSIAAQAQRVAAQQVQRKQSLTTEGTAPAEKRDSPQSLEKAQAELEGLRQAERDELERIDRVFRGYLEKLTLLHELYLQALEALRGIENEDGLLAVQSALRSDDARYRRIAVKVLRLRNWQPKTVQDKLDFLIVPAKVPQTEAEASKKIAALIAETSSVQDLLDVIEPRLSEEGLTDLQAVLLEHLCSLHSEQTLTRLQAVMTSSLEPPSLKVKVCRSLPDIGTTGALNLLIEAMDELDMEVRTAAAEALGRIGQVMKARSLDEKEQEAVRSARERLVFALRDGDVTVREAAAKALRHFPEARDGLVSSLAGDRNPNAREYAALALESFEPDKAATEVLLKALQDEDAAVRKAAAQALKKQAQVPEDPELRIRFLCAGQNWKELRKQGVAATDSLKVLLRDRNEDVRRSVVETLGAIRAAGAVRELGISLSDSHQDVRREAAVALRLIGDPAALDALRTALPKEGFREVKAEIERTIQKLEAK